MRKASKIGLAVVAGAVTALAPMGVANAGGSTAVPAGTASFDSGNCTAQFVRSSSGIVNETNRVCQGAQNPWTSYNVILQFRPVNGTPNPNCDPAGQVTPTFQFTNNESSISKWFGTTTYNVCVYYAPNQQMAAGTVDSANQNGSTATLPTAGKFRIDVSGTWNNTSHGLVDAEYDNGDHQSDWSDPLFTQDGWSGLGADWGDLLVNGAAVGWGSYNDAHAYSYSLASGSNSITLSVFDGDASSGSLVYNPGWYGDNVGSLNYTITYLGQ